MGQHFQLAEMAVFPADIAAARAQIEAWRRTRPKKGPMPEEFWDAAVSLATVHGLYRISRDLTVDYGTLQARLALVQAVKEEPPAAMGGFVAVDARQLVGRSAGEGAVLELSRPDGARLELRFPAHEPVDVPGLVAAFVGRGA